MMKSNKISVYLNGKDVKCIGWYDVNTHELTMLSGSYIRKKISSHFKYNEKRMAQISEYCHEEGNSFVLDKDVSFKTPTAAAKFSLGYEVNGPLYWQTDKKKLKSFLQKEINEKNI